MGAASRQREVLEELRRQIRLLERKPARRTGVLPSGRPEVDALLPGGGFPRGSVTELVGGPASGKTQLALRALRGVQESGALAAFVDGRGEFYPPAAMALGIDPARLLIVRPGAGERGGGETVAGLWAAEALLASGAFAAVIVDVSLRSVPAGRAEAMLRRLRGAAEKGGAAALRLGAPRDPSSSAALRLELGGSERSPIRLIRGETVAQAEGEGDAA
jgi:protein ImuA